MTKKTNKRFLLMGAASAVLMLLAGHVHLETGSELARHLVGFFMFAAFVLLVLLGVVPWVGTFALRYPLHNTTGYRNDYAAEPERETSLYMSQGWRRKRERAMLRNLKAFSLYIEPDEMS